MTPYLQDHKPTSSGMLLRNIEARIIDEKGEDVAEGQPGELIVRCVIYRFERLFVHYALSDRDIHDPFSGCRWPNAMKSVDLFIMRFEGTLTD